LQYATNNAVKNHEEIQNHSIPTALLATSDQDTEELKKDANDPGTENSRQSAASTQLQCRITSFDLEQAARQEALVLKRVNQLRREGLWTASSLPKCAEPPRLKVHSDNLMDELSWMARDFDGERKLKRACCKRISASVAKAYREREEGELRQNTEAEKHVKRVASLLSKHVRPYMNMIVLLFSIAEYKNERIVKSKRERAMGTHLNILLDRSEKFKDGSNWNSNLETRLNTTNTYKCCYMGGISSSASSDKESNDSDVDDDADSVENTAEVVGVPETSSWTETTNAALKLSTETKENSISKKVTEPRVGKVKTLLEEQSELDDNKAAGESNAAGNIYDTDRNVSTSSKKQVEEEKAESSTSPFTADEEETVTELDDYTQSNETSSWINYQKLQSENVEERREGLAHIAEEVERLQPKGYTLETTTVNTRIPFLLKFSLREYQHVGLDWLVMLDSRGLNGILADEMGLGKTIQTIALLAHHACQNNIWGPHLIIVPTTVILNWEMEFKKWCPAFKIFTYYGSTKERKEKRKGWNRPNAFHVCITSYKLVIRDYSTFRRKAWQYMILDEAQHIKNYKSERWQMLLHFRARRRLLLTGTPLQNSVMELWSLMHFLMPDIFCSDKDFREWFSNPLTGMVEGTMEFNDQVIKRLHHVLRPFLLRRLKSEVEKQLPKKYEHLIKCSLSKRQRYLYDEFMSRSNTKAQLATGSIFNIISVLMQLRKVCNHPNLFEQRPVMSPLVLDPIIYRPPSLVCDLPSKCNLETLPLRLNVLRQEFSSGFACNCSGKLFSTKFEQPCKIESLPQISELPVGLFNFKSLFLNNRNTTAQLDNSRAVVKENSNVKDSSDQKLAAVIPLKKRCSTSNGVVSRSASVDVLPKGAGSSVKSEEKPKVIYWRLNPIGGVNASGGRVGTTRVLRPIYTATTSRMPRPALASRGPCAAGPSLVRLVRPSFGAVATRAPSVATTPAASQQCRSPAAVQSYHGGALRPRVGTASRPPMACRQSFLQQMARPNGGSPTKPLSARAFLDYRLQAAGTVAASGRTTTGMIHVRLPASNPISFSGQSSAPSTASSLRVGAGAKVNIRCSVPNQNILMPKGALIQLHAGKLCIPIRPVPPPASTASSSSGTAVVENVQLKKTPMVAALPSTTYERGRRKQQQQQPQQRQQPQQHQQPTGQQRQMNSEESPAFLSPVENCNRRVTRRRKATSQVESSSFADSPDDDFNVAAESKKIALRSGTTVGGGSKRRRSAAVVASTSSSSDSSKLRRSTRSSFKAAVEKNSNIFAPSTHSDDHHYNNEDEGEELPSRSGDVERMGGTSTQGTVSFDPEAETSLEKAILKLLNKQVNDLWSEITLSKAETKLRIQNNLINQNRERCLARPMYGSDLRMAFTIEKRSVPLSRTLEDIFQSVRFLLQQFLVYVPAALISEPLFRPTYRSCAVEYAEVAMRTSMNRLLKNKLDVFRAVEYAQRLCFPELRLIEYDCGKLQSLSALLRRLQAEGHRCLIFTQMARMLDILEAFLSYHGYMYLRLDGATNIERRQMLMERFNHDKKILCFILSTRSGGVGVNLTGADTVIFYDSDWNPTMDAQAQDRCHRIGQTRDVHIYRLICERTIEENILLKATQKRKLGELAIDEGGFKADFFHNTNIKELFDMEESVFVRDVSDADIQQAMSKVEDDNDAIAARIAVDEAQAEERADEEEDDENATSGQKKSDAVQDANDNPVAESSDPDVLRVLEEMKDVLSKMSEVERYALEYIEEERAFEFSEELKGVDNEIEERKMALMQAHYSEMRSARTMQEAEAGEEFAITYDRRDAFAKVRDGDFNGESVKNSGKMICIEDPSLEMPIWTPLSPPLSDDDSRGSLKPDHLLGELYERLPIDQSILAKFPSSPSPDDDRSVEMPILRIPDKMPKLGGTTTTTTNNNNNRRASPFRGRSAVQVRDKSVTETINSVARFPPPALSISVNSPKSLFELLSSKGRKESSRSYNPSIMGMDMKNYEVFPWNVIQDYALIRSLLCGHCSLKSGNLPSRNQSLNWEYVSDFVRAHGSFYHSPRQCCLRYYGWLHAQDEKTASANMAANNPTPTPNATATATGSVSLQTGGEASANVSGPSPSSGASSSSTGQGSKRDGSECSTKKQRKTGTHGSTAHSGKLVLKNISDRYKRDLNKTNTQRFRTISIMGASTFPESDSFTFTAGLLPTELIDDEPAEQQKDDVDINSEEMKETFFESLFIPVMTSSNLEEDGCQSDDDEDLESATVELQERMAATTQKMPTLRSTPSMDKLLFDNWLEEEKRNCQTKTDFRKEVLPYFMTSLHMFDTDSDDETNNNDDVDDGNGNINRSSFFRTSSRDSSNIINKGSESDEDIDDEKDDDDNNTNDGNVHPDVNDEHRRLQQQQQQKQQQQQQQQQQQKHLHEHISLKEIIKQEDNRYYSGDFRPFSPVLLSTNNNNKGDNSAPPLPDVVTVKVESSPLPTVKVEPVEFPPYRRYTLPPHFSANVTTTATTTTFPTTNPSVTISSSPHTRLASFIHPIMSSRQLTMPCSNLPTEVSALPRPTTIPSVRTTSSSSVPRQQQQQMMHRAQTLKVLCPGRMRIGNSRLRSLMGRAVPPSRIISTSSGRPILRGQGITSSIGGRTIAIRTYRPRQPTPTTTTTTATTISTPATVPSTVVRPLPSSVAANSSLAALISDPPRIYTLSNRNPTTPVVRRRMPSVNVLAPRGLIKREPTTFTAYRSSSNQQH
ncbi:Helicase ssl-1, partial [Trichinella sp. T6]